MSCSQDGMDETLRNEWRKRNAKKKQPGWRSKGRREKGTKEERWYLYSTGVKVSTGGAGNESQYIIFHYVKV